MQSSPILLQNIGIAYKFLKKYDQAYYFYNESIKAYDALKITNPQYKYLLKLMGDLLKEMGRQEEAEDYYEKAKWWNRPNNHNY